METTKTMIGTFGTYYNFGISKDKLPDGPELAIYLKDKGLGSDSFTIPGKHLAAFCTELIHMARELGVTGDEREATT